MTWANEIQCFNECFSAIIIVTMMKIMMMTMIVAVCSEFAFYWVL